MGQGSRANDSYRGCFGAFVFAGGRVRVVSRQDLSYKCFQQHCSGLGVPSITCDCG